MSRIFLLVLSIALTGLSAPGWSAELLESYQAYLSNRDHFNSRGVRLHSAAAIIRQDRANYHRFGKRDSADEPDGFFSSKANRARLERMLERGQASRRVLNQIINSTPIIRVKIYGSGSSGTRIEVFVE